MGSTSRFFLLIATVIALPVENNATSAKLYKHLFNDDYVKQVRPIRNSSNVLNLKIKFLLRGISDFDEVGGQLSLMTALDLRWRDEYLHWNTSEFPIRTLVVPEDDIWTPKLTIANPTDRIILFEEDTFNARIYPNGAIIWLQGGTIKSTCIPNVKMYPFDTHHCKVTVLPLNYIATEIRIFPEVDISTFEQFGEWNLGNWSVKPKLFAGYFSSVILELNIKRKPEFSLLSIIIPILFLGVLNSCVFLLPVESGERVSFAITVLLSFAVFLTIVSAMMPKNSDPVPVLCYILTIMMAFSGLIMFCTILNLRWFYLASDKPASNVFQVIFRKCRRKHKEGIKYNGALNDNTEISRETHDVEMVTWKRVSEVIDIVYFVLFLVLFFATVAVYLILVHPHDSDE